MRINCPQCHSFFELVATSHVDDEATVADASPAGSTVACPRCGGQVLTSPVEEVPQQKPNYRIGQFELLEQLGQGQFGIVWKALDTELDRIVAIKIPRTLEIFEQGAELFLREARAVARLNHSNIVRLHDVKRGNDMLVIVSELVDGITLQQRLKVGRLPFREAVELCVKLANGLQHAHENGVIHRDLKPSNVLLDRQGVPKLTDFGLAKRDAVDITITCDGQVLGTPAYMPPEQARGASNAADARSDIYSLGMILYEMLAGRLPFSGSSADITEIVKSGDIPTPRRFNKAIPRDLETICLRAISLSPELRFQSAIDMAADLERYLKDQPIQSRPTSILERGWKWSRRYPWQIATMVLATILLAAISPSLVSPKHKELLASTAPGISVGQVPPLFEVKLLTEPDGARAILYRRDPRTGEPLPHERYEQPGRTPLVVNLPAGDYLVVVVMDDGRFHEVYRRVSDDRDFPNFGAQHMFVFKAAGKMPQWNAIKIPPLSVTKGMAEFSGSEEFMMGETDDPTIPVHYRTVKPFYLDCREVSAGEFFAIKKRNPTTSKAIMVKPSDGTTAVNNLYQHDAVDFAEACGKRLMTEAEYEFAATLGGTRRYPWGNQPPPGDWKIGPPGQPEFDCLPTDPPVYGLYSNVAEWTSSWGMLYPQLHSELVLSPADVMTTRVVRGAPLAVIESKSKSIPVDGIHHPRERSRFNWLQHPPNVGIRMARSVRPRLNSSDFEQILRRR